MITSVETTASFVIDNKRIIFKPKNKDCKNIEFFNINGNFVYSALFNYNDSFDMSFLPIGIYLAKADGIFFPFEIK